MKGRAVTLLLQYTKHTPRVPALAKPPQRTHTLVAHRHGLCACSRWQHANHTAHTDGTCTTKQPMVDIGCSNQQLNQPLQPQCNNTAHKNMHTQTKASSHLKASGIAGRAQYVQAHTCHSTSNQMHTHASPISHTGQVLQETQNLDDRSTTETPRSAEPVDSRRGLGAVGFLKLCVTHLGVLTSVRRKAPLTKRAGTPQDHQPAAHLRLAVAITQSWAQTLVLLGAPHAPK